MKLTFPDNFIFGTSTATQIEQLLSMTGKVYRPETERSLSKAPITRKDLGERGHYPIRCAKLPDRADVEQATASAVSNIRFTNSTRISSLHTGSKVKRNGNMCGAILFFGITYYGRNFLRPATNHLSGNA